MEWSSQFNRAFVSVLPAVRSIQFVLKFYIIRSFLLLIYSTEDTHEQLLNQDRHSLARKQ